jgi:hypothetical protein
MRVMNRLIVPALSCALVFPALAFGAERVGNIGAANSAAFGTPPSASRHSLAPGLGVEKGERIDTSQEGNAQIVFNDTSTMTVGHNSSVTIDDFAYQGGGGSQGLRFAKGVLRFVGGGVSHQSGASLRTPTAAVGVRGGSVLMRIGGDCGTLVVHQVGIVRVDGAMGASQILNRPGFGVCANENGVSEPFRVSGQTIAAITAEMASHGRQRGGARHLPANEAAAVALGDHAPASVQPTPGLDALGPVWAGNALVQSRANADNQPAPPPASPPARQPPTDEGPSTDYVAPPTTCPNCRLP